MHATFAILLAAVWSVRMFEGYTHCLDGTLVAEVKFSGQCKACPVGGV